MANSNSLVKVVEVCRVAPNPGSPDSATPDSLPLTLFDIRWLRFAPVQRLYFYEISSTDSILPKLKASLSLTLQHFLPLAGNLTWPQDSLKPILCYAEGDTVSLTVAESAANFGHLSSKYDLLGVQEYHPLVPQLEVSHERSAVMALQITIFPNRGFSIGTSMHHAVLDGKTSTSFLKSWAHICKHEELGSSSSLLPDELKPFYDRMVIQDLAELGALYSDQYQNMDGPNNRSLMVWNFQAPPESIRGTFKVCHAKIQKLRQHVMTRMVKKKQHDDSEASVLRLSTFSLACAYTWVCLVKAQEAKEDKTRLIFPVDCRSRLDPPIPATYFGNCIAGRLAIAETKGLLGEDGLVVAVSAIIEAIKGLDDGVLNGAENWVSRLCTVLSDRVASIAGSHRFGVYETDFGWGIPKKVDLVSIDRTGAISLSDTNDSDGGLDVGLVLQKHHTEVFASLFAKGLENL
ncbi:phenolic glucoside malonyltransferase 1-like [Rosa rugosa]|uniref:phenolic glucoside malonyltransferase 1-like n=1 Tax=Rosa rugosa TaxID=74645 RepID=UPI002B40B5C2|nr:phenolic glucoside malonyltransferase 1-like [Rosa rugosa]XP_062009781.1 phenolic glucoside malonyltransferase 1-like [Rosa rugosa]XP_062009782.1 phenolic glucoside malonyltransferase 1-like [Rosa rugosa]